MPRYIGAYRGGVRPSAPTTVYRTCALSLPCHSEPVTDVTGVGIRSPFHASGGLFSFNSERKEEKKRRQKLRFWISLRAFARRLSRLFYHANAVPCKFPLNVALSLLLFSLPLLL